MSIGTSPWNLIRLGLKRNVPQQDHLENVDVEDNAVKRIWLPDIDDDYDYEDNIVNNEMEDVSDDVIKKYIRGKIIEQQCYPTLTIFRKLLLHA